MNTVAVTVNPNDEFIVVVTDTAFPKLSTIEKCVVSSDSFMTIFPLFISDDLVLISLFIVLNLLLR